MSTAEKKFKIGDKVVWSVRGLGQLHPRTPTDHGKVIGYSSVLSVWVQWASRKTKQSLHVSFVEKLP